MAKPSPIPDGFTPVLSPVRRLEAIIRKAASDQQLMGQSAGITLSVLVGLQPPGERRNWSRAYVEVTDLLEEARHQASASIENFEDSPHARTFEEILKIFQSISLDNGWGSYAGSLNHLANIALPFVVHATDGFGPPPAIQTDQFNQLREDLDKLLNQVLNSSLPPQFKEEFARNLGALRDTIVRFHVHGPDGVARAAVQVVGHVVLNEASTKADKSVVKSTIDLVSKIQDVFLKSVQIGRIGAAVWKLIGPGS